MLTEASFYITNILLGVALAADAFSVSLANGLNEPCMRFRKTCLISGTFGFFQALMPFIGWVLLKTLVTVFEPLVNIIPWVALILLSFIGGKMLIEGIKNKECADACACGKRLGFSALLVQGVATSIDALSAGLNFVQYDIISALLAAFIIAVVTFIICIFGVEIGKKTGMKLAGKAGIIGGAILILIGLEIFITGIF